MYTESTTYMCIQGLMLIPFLVCLLSIWVDTINV